MKTTLRKRIFIVFLTLAMLVVPLCETLTPTAEAATKKTTNKKAKKLYQKKINQLRKTMGGVSYKYADINRDGITDVMIEHSEEYGRHISLTFLIYTYKQGKLVKLFEQEYSARYQGEVKVIGYKGGFIVHIVDYLPADVYHYYKKTSAGKYQYVATKCRYKLDWDRGYGDWEYSAKSGSEWVESQRAFDKQVKKIKTGTRKYYGNSIDWDFKWPIW